MKKNSKNKPVQIQKVKKKVKTPVMTMQERQAKVIELLAKKGFGPCDA